ncbi:hypothetical protein FHG87_007269 [Trinorchestia longiramus]|nr:hypothetical protein FHG87_007269 [Trinorchestia longiramus]
MLRNVIVPVLHLTSDRMFRLALTACILVVAWGAVPNPKTANQILDAIIERANEKIRDVNWDDFKKIQNGETEFNLGVSSSNGDSETGEDFKITNAKMTGILLDRSKSAEFLENKTVLSGILKLTNTRAIADYEIQFPGSGEVEGHTVKGTLTEKADHLFADVEIKLDENLVPQAISNFEVRSGRDELESSSGLNANWSKVDIAGIRSSLLQLMKTVFSTNVKVKVNQAIQEWKSEASS